jgi:RNA polymerase sigma factor (sigma-70 family)
MKGDREAFGLLFRRHYSILFQYGNKICKDRTILEDCIQELFIEIWQKKPDQALHSAKAYLLQALKFKLYKSFRSRKSFTTIDEPQNLFFEMGHDNFMIDQQEDHDKAQKILETINKLPARQKEVIYLRIYKGLSYEEVSEIMQINYQVVRNLLYQALKTFRKLITPLIMALIIFWYKMI